MLQGAEFFTARFQHVLFKRGMPETCTSNQYIWIGASSDSQLHDDAVIAISGHAHQNSHSKK